MEINNKKYNLVVIGGGPTGMMAAISAARAGASVLILEKNESLGKKLLMTGGGRCNFTQHGQSARDLVAQYGSSNKFLFSAFTLHSPNDTIEFFRSLGVESKIESGRVFPQSERADDILLALENELKKLKVKILLSSSVKEIIKNDNKISVVRLTDGREIVADFFLLCVGGQSYPSTGSTGDGYVWLRQIGHGITTPRPALASLRLHDKWIHDLSGVSLSDVELTIKRNNKIGATSRGNLLLTHFGISGPAALNLTAKYNLHDKGMLLYLDVLPGANEEKWFIDWSANFYVNRIQLRVFLSKIFPARFVESFLQVIKFDGDRLLNSISHKDIRTLIRELKNIKFSFGGVFGFDAAMVTAGGVLVSEVDPKTMRSRVVDNLFLAGEILDVTGPTGGYNLQICWSTGWLAGKSAADLKKNS